MKRYFLIWRPGVLIILCTFIHSFKTSDHSFYKDFFDAPPPGADQKIYAGFGHTLAIKADSTLWAWGKNNQGQIGNGNTNNVLTPFMINGMGGIAKAAGGYEHTIVLKGNGTIWAWGRNSEGQVGDGTTTQRLTPVIVGGGITNMVNVGAGYYHSLAIKNNGTVWAWGRNNYGQLGNGNSFNAVAPMQVTSITTAIEVVGGEFHSVALKADGTVWTWGRNNTGQLGNGNTNNQNVPVQVSGISTATTIAAGRNHTLALKADGTVWAWGSNVYGQLGNGNTGNQITPVQVSGLTNVIRIAAGENHSLAIKSDGTIWAWGYNGEGQLGNETADGNPHSTPIQTGSITTWSMICAGTQSIGVKSDNNVWAWGNNSTGQFGDGTSSNAFVPQLSLFSFASVASIVDRPVFSPDGGNYTTAQTVIISCSTAGATIHYTTNGIDPTVSDPVITSGSGISIPSGTTILKARAFKAGLTQSAVKAAAYQAGEKLMSGYSHSLAIKPDGTLWTWGNNSQGQIGNGSNGNVLFPFQLAAMTNIKDAAGGFEHSLALKADGTVWAWGRNSEGQLGNGTLNSTNTPVAVGLLTNIVNVGAGYQHSLAIKDDGTVWAWGQNNYGQLGNGSTFNSVAAVQVSSLTGVIDVTGGDGFSVALKSDGTVWTWGNNGNGQLGDGTAIQRNVPIQVNITNVIAIAAGRYHVMVLKADGTIWTWGYSVYGQLGNTEGLTVPAQVTVLTNIKAIAAGENHSMAIKNDGTLWTWGYNGQGQLGIGTADADGHSSPIQIGILTNWTTVSASTHSMSVKNDGSVWAWGNNASGQFGNGTSSSAISPQVSLFNFASLPPLVAKPVMSPDGGGYNTSVAVTFNCSTAGAVIHYTTDGKDPSEADPVIASGSTINTPAGITVLKARAFKIGLTPSNIKAAVYQVGEKAICGYSHSMAIRTNGKLWAWGNNNAGQLGTGGTEQKNVPVQIDPANAFIDVAGGFEHTILIKSDGRVYATGRNTEGQLGDGTFTQRTKLTLIKSVSNAINVATGYYHSMAIKNDSTLWVWGLNTSGQLGDGTTFNSVAPHQVKLIKGLIDVAGGEEHSVGLKNDGTVWTWGRNSMGQLGDGTTVQRNSPVLINGINAMAIAAGRNHTLALGADGTVWAWGENNKGQLGIGTNVNQNLPVPVIGLNNIIAIAAGEYYSLAIKNDGSIFAWGDNAQGQLGDVTNLDQSRPVRVSALANVVSMSAGNQTLFITPLTGVNVYWATGNNNQGQLGDSTQTNRNFRVLVHFPFDQNNNSIPDWVEFNGSGLSDTDRDGLADWKELMIYGTDPANFDCNNDGLADGVNVFIGLLPKILDTDGDGISNIQEILNGTSPILADTDGDGVADNIDAFPLDRFRSSLPPPNPSDHTPPVIILIEPI